jgi:hypothetical protein
MVHIMGGHDSPNFELFESLCIRAYNIIRENGHLLLSLCSLMVGTGLPQLASLQDLSYMRDTLCLEKSDAEAAAEFKRMITKARNNTRVRFNNFIHAFVN